MQEALVAKPRSGEHLELAAALGCCLSIASTAPPQDSPKDWVDLLEVLAEEVGSMVRSPRCYGRMIVCRAVPGRLVLEWDPTFATRHRCSLELKELLKESKGSLMGGTLMRDW